MPLIPRHRDNAHPPEGPNVNDWASQLPPDATIHVKEGSAYIDSFPAHEAQSDMTVEEILLARYGVGTYELAGRHNGLFLPGREKVHVGSQSDRQAARHAQATRDAQGSGGALGDLPQVVGILKDLGWAPGQQANQGNHELTTLLVQHAVQSLRPPDPGETMDQVVGLMKSVQEFQRANAPPPPPGRKRRRKKQNASHETGSTSNPRIGGMVGAAALAGVDFAMRHPDMTQRVSAGISAKAQGAVNWFRQKTQAPAEGRAGATTEGGEATTAANPTVTLEQAIESAKTMLATPVGQRMVDYVRGSIHDVAPEDIARHGLEGARQWLGPNHPLLLRLHESPGRVFDEMSQIVGLTGEPWWKARRHFVAMMASEGGETPASPPSDGEAPHAFAQGDTALPREPVARHGGDHDAEDARDAYGSDGAAGPATGEDERAESTDAAKPDGGG